MAKKHTEEWRTPENHSRILTMLYDGVPRSKIAETVGVPVRWVRTIAERRIRTDAMLAKKKLLSKTDEKLGG